MNKALGRWSTLYSLIFLLFLHCVDLSYASEKGDGKRKQLEDLQKRFEWWPTDARPGPVKDEDRGGYWWWPTQPGTARPWGNRGYIYVYKIIFDYKAEELPPPKAQELRPSLLVKRIIKNTKIYFDYDKSNLRNDHLAILEKTVGTLKKTPDADILITGNCDTRGSEAYNLKLGRERAGSVKSFMLDKGISEERIRIISRGKLDAMALVSDLEGMQKDRNAHFIIAEVEEAMIPYPGEAYGHKAVKIDNGTFLIEKEEKVESGIKVSSKEYVVKKGDTLWKIAEREYGGGHRWKYLYEFNKDRINDPNKLRTGQKLMVPVE